VHRERVALFFAALARELRARGVTALYTAETANLVGPELEAPLLGISAAADNMVLLRHVELRTRLHRLLSVLKTRSSGFDARLREFRVTDSGIEIADTFESAEAILSGFASEVGERRSGGPPPKRGPAKRR
jgi:circadian clock protein KaiC